MFVTLWREDPGFQGQTRNGSRQFHGFRALWSTYVQEGFAESVSRHHAKVLTRRRDQEIVGHFPLRQKFGDMDSVDAISTNYSFVFDPMANISTAVTRDLRAEQIVPPWIEEMHRHGKRNAVIYVAVVLSVYFAGILFLLFKHWRQGHWTGHSANYMDRLRRERQSSRHRRRAAESSSRLHQVQSGAILSFAPQESQNIALQLLPTNPGFVCQNSSVFQSERVSEAAAVIFRQGDQQHIVAYGPITHYQEGDEDVRATSISLEPIRPEILTPLVEEEVETSSASRCQPTSVRVTASLDNDDVS
ncbi:unnamed protein product [Notodromas monacha]|uniref:Uncharacterized protein n=1 Tax=Notodromas monacha TaxID=399045 RepID=A0A7R9BX92_9CRUS|nr:unnamed protein product [Notodromas monacha]CAG0922348.1 unnamed protein product [Notodromas monacha]